MEYQLIVEKDDSTLNRRINMLLKDGWQLYGDHQVTMTYEPENTRRGILHIRYSQAMVKHDFAFQVRNGITTAMSVDEEKEDEALAKVTAMMDVVSNY